MRIVQLSHATSNFTINLRCCGLRFVNGELKKKM